MHTRFWGWLAIKLVGAGAITFALALLLLGLSRVFWQTRLSVDAVLFASFLLLPAASAVLWRICFADQRHRCRICTRQLRMPLCRGSWSALLLNTPETEYVCPYGCGKLVEPVSVSRYLTAQWVRHGDIWQELFRRP
jgi:hypothetical protein